MTDFPKIFRVRQNFPRPRLADVAAEVHAQFGRLGLRRTIRSGQSVAITAGSRGIANIAAILGATVRHLHVLGARPFLVPAMGSHGGGTAEGQAEVLASYGVTEAQIGCPIRASMETTIVGRAQGRLPTACRPRGIRGEPHCGVQPREAAYDVRGRLPKRPDEDAADRPGQASRSRRASPRDRGPRLRQDRPQRGGRRHPEVPRRSGAGDCRKRVRRDGPDRGRRCPPTSRFATARCSPRPGNGWPGCRSTPSMCW